MKCRSNNIKAFTILEIVISLAIMSIIVAMVYVIYSLLSKQLYEYKSETELVNNYSQLDVALKRDIYSSKKLSYIDGELHLSNDSKTIRYKESNNKLIRKSSSVVDTFLVHVEEFKIYEEDFLLGNNRKRIAVRYKLFDQELEAVYFKDFGVADHINKTFFANGN